MSCRVLMVATLMLIATPAAAAAQPVSTLPGAEQPAPTSLRVQVVISRHQGDKTISRVPHTLLVTTESRATQLRMGARVPIRTGETFQYENVGTQIDCSAVTLKQEGQYVLNITVDDSTPFQTENGIASDLPSFRSFRAAQSVVLRDGQTTQFTMSTDKVTSEVVRVEVGLTVLK